MRKVSAFDSHEEQVSGIVFAKKSAKCAKGSDLLNTESARGANVERNASQALSCEAQVYFRAGLLPAGTHEPCSGCKQILQWVQTNPAVAPGRCRRQHFSLIKSS